MDSKIMNVVLRAQGLLDGGVVPPKPIDVLDPIQVLRTVITTAYAIAGVAAVVYLIYGGYTYMMSAGDTQKVEKAQKTLANAVIGLVIVIVSSILITFIAGLFGVENLILFINLPVL
jgi:hypothetical protein